MAEVREGASGEINAEEQPNPELVRHFLERIKTTSPETLAEELALEQQRRDAEKTRLEEERAAAEATSRVDKLTELGSLEAYEEEISRAIKAAISTRKKFSIIFCDIDKFKDVNDKHPGKHQAGNAVLKRVAKVLEKSTKEGIDRVFRYGGEEIVTIAPVDLETAIGIAERQRRNVEQSAADFEGDSIRVTISSGVSCFDPRKVPLLASLDPNDHEKNKQIVDTVVRQTSKRIMLEADAAMYAAKEAGRNMVAFKEEDSDTVGIIKRDPQNSGNTFVERVPFQPKPK